MISAPPIPTPSPPVSTRPVKELIEAAYALGVPCDYGRTRGLKPIREPKRLAFIGHDTQNRPQWLAPLAARRAHLSAAALHAGVDLQVVSAFRSVEYQLGILERKLARGQSIDEILHVSAAPGYSEHHSGRALDLTTPGYAPLEQEFECSAAFTWLCTNAQRYGFHLSYPRGNPQAMAYEPWHWCWSSNLREARVRAAGRMG